MERSLIASFTGLLPTLAYAQATDQSDSAIKVSLFCIAALVVVAALGLVAIATARSRVPNWSQAVMAAAVVWSVITAASIIVTMLARMHWASEQDILLKSGYYDPTTAPPAPSYPIGLWAILAGAYGIGLIALILGKRRQVGA